MSPRRRRLFRMGSRRRRQDELDEEIRAHLQMRTDDLVARGWDPDQAADEARRRFGPPGSLHPDLARSARRRDRRLARAAFRDGVRADARLAVRRITRAPGFSALAAATLALGIGLTTSMFAAVDQVLLRPLPFPAPERLVTLMSVTEEGNAFPRVSVANWLDWEAGNESLEASAVFLGPVRPIVELPSGPMRPAAARVSPAFFDVLRARTAAGRTFTAADLHEGQPVAVVSASFWQDRMGAAPLPADLVVAGVTRRVVGALDGREVYPAGTEVWLPEVVTGADAGSRNNINWEAVARLREGVGPEQARADLGAIAAGIRERDPEARYSWGVGVQSLHETLVGDVRSQLWMLLGAVGAVLLIACLNVAGLAGSRALRRSGEIGVRRALGAGRGRVVRELLVEHGALALLGAVLGVALAGGLLAVLERHAGTLLPVEGGLELDLRALAFALAVTVVAALLAGLVPAMRAAAGDPGRVGTGSRGGDARGRNRAGTFLVVGEVALALTLLVGGSLLVRSFRTLVERDTGFDPRGVLTVEVVLDRPGYRLPWNAGPDHAGARARQAFWSRLVAASAELPGVEAVGMAHSMPTFDGATGFIELEGGGVEQGGAGYRAIGGEYFQALGIPLLAGRLFDGRDAAGTERTVVVNQAMARAFWPGQDPVGRRVRATSMEALGREAPWLTVVGVVGDVRHFGYATPPQPEMYVLAEQVPFWMGAMHLVVDAGHQVPGGLAPALREVVRSVDPGLPVQASVLEGRVQGWVSERLFVTSLLGMFGVLAALMAGVGLYGLLAFLVAGRTREMGIRAALGARPGDIVAGVLRRSLALCGAGLALGLVGAYWAGQALASLLVDVGAADPWSYLAAASVLVLASVAAAWLPARRAAAVSPVTALRQE